MSELLFNELPRPTFRWLRVNHTVSSLAGEDTSVQSIAVEANQNILSPLPTGTALLMLNMKVLIRMLFKHWWIMQKVMLSMFLLRKRKL